MRILATLMLVLAGPALAADARPLEDLVEGRCALCHGLDGESASTVYPRLAAQHPEYLQKQLHDFREGRRKGSMNEMAADLSDAEITALAGYFAAKAAPAERPGDTDLVAVGRYVHLKGNPYSGVAACATCHGPDGHGTQQLPRLAGQLPTYLETQLKNFNQRLRTNDNAVMHTIAAKLTELEIKAVAAYLSTLR